MNIIFFIIIIYYNYLYNKYKHPKLLMATSNKTWPQYQTNTSQVI